VERGAAGHSGPRALVVVALALVLAAGLAGVWAGPAAAKSFSITDVSIDATVQSNGDVTVHETRTLDFSGSFHYVFWDYDAKGSDGIKVTGATGPDSASASAPYQLSNDSQAPVGMQLAPGTYSVQDTTGGIRVQLNFAVADTSASFGVDYTALGAAKRWEDTAELYWQFVGAETAVPADHVRITVHLPQGVQKGEVRAWTHGPLWGDVVIEPDGSVVSTVSPLPAYTFVESRILFPASALPQAKQRSAARLSVVLAEEKSLADKANRERWLARAKVAFWAVVGIGIPLVALILVIVLYVRFGREPKPRFQAPYLRDIPEPSLPPALVGFIWRMGTVGREDATATLLDLINRGVIDIERVEYEEAHLLGKSEKVSYKLTVHEEKLDGLLPYEHHLVNFLFTEIAGGWSFVIADLKDLAKAKRTAFAAGYKEFTDMVGEEGTKRGYLDAKADRMAFTGAAFGFIAAVAAGVAGIFGRFYWALVGLPIGIALIFVSRSIKRRSAEAAELYAQYQALRRYMKDFGRMDEKPPDSVVLWQQFLVYAVVFDMADQVIKAMQVKVPDVMQDPAFRTMTFMMIAQPGMGPSPFSAMDQSFGQAVAVATSNSSSGGGGGGGFSGGGGGGGGGGGFGAG
jgi:uncharacterized membrane protein